MHYDWHIIRHKNIRSLRRYIAETWISPTWRRLWLQTEWRHCHPMYSRHDILPSGLGDRFCGRIALYRGLLQSVVPHPQSRVANEKAPDGISHCRIGAPTTNRMYHKRFNHIFQPVLTSTWSKKRKTAELYTDRHKKNQRLPMRLDFYLDSDSTC